MVAAVIGEHHVFKSPAFCQPRCYGQHYPVAERHDSTLHVLLAVATFGYGVGAAQEGGLEIFAHEVKGYRHVFYVEVAAVVGGTFYLALVMVGTVVETHGERDTVFVLIEHSDGVHPAGKDEYSIFFHSL